MKIKYCYIDFVIGIINGFLLIIIPLIILGAGTLEGGFNLIDHSLWSLSVSVYSDIFKHIYLYLVSLLPVLLISYIFLLPYNLFPSYRLNHLNVSKSKSSIFYFAGITVIYIFIAYSYYAHLACWQCLTVPPAGGLISLPLD
jgi:hypothetical protein